MYPRLMLAAVGFFASFAACGSESDTTCGAAGGTQACVCASGAPGAQTCEASGAWTVCVCADTDTVGGDTSSPVDTEVSIAPDTVVSGCADRDATNFDQGEETCLYAVTFSVDMSYEGLSESDVVYVGGDFQVALGNEAWCGACTPMAPAGDDVYVVTVALPNGTYQHKFQVNAWASSEDVPEACGLRSGQFVNRTFEVKDAPVTVTPVRYGACDTSPPVMGCTDSDATNFAANAVVDDGSCTYTVSFAVDMTDYGPLQIGDVIYVNINGQQHAMSTPDFGFTWATVQPLPVGLAYYYFNINEDELREWIPEQCRTARPVGEPLARGVQVVDGPIELPKVEFGACR